MRNTGKKCARAEFAKRTALQIDRQFQKSEVGTVLNYYAESLAASIRADVPAQEVMLLVSTGLACELSSTLPALFRIVRVDLKRQGKSPAFARKVVQAAKDVLSMRAQEGGAR